MFVFKICTYRFLEGQAFKDSPSYKLKWKYFKKKPKRRTQFLVRNPFSLDLVEKGIPTSLILNYFGLRLML